MNNKDDFSQADNNNGTLGREVEAEHNNSDTIHQGPNPEGAAENERHMPNRESHIDPEETVEKHYPTENNSPVQKSHAENNEGTAAEGV